MAVETIPSLFAVVAIPVERGVGIAAEVVQPADRRAGGDLRLQVPKAPTLSYDAHRRGCVAGLGLKIDGAADSRPTVSKRVSSFVYLDGFGVQQLQRLEVSEAVGVAVRHPVDEKVDAPQMKVVS